MATTENDAPSPFDILPYGDKSTVKELIRVYFWLRNYLETGDFRNDGYDHLVRLTDVIRSLDSEITPEKLKQMSDLFWWGEEREE